MIIGLVLSNTPVQSETFFRSKIKGLQERGFQVMLFANQTEDFHLCPIIPHPKINNNIILQLARMLVTYTMLFIQHPVIFFRFLHLERMDRIPIRSRWENLYLNSHILREKLDWLHFGFATTALRRENSALAIGARMGVSLRGYDICIYPLKHPGCYQRFWDKVDKVHSISYALLETAEKHGLTKEIPQVIVQPAIDIENFNFRKKNWIIFNDKEKIKLLSVARLHWKKGLEYTLQALAILKEKNIPFQYTIVGDGTENERLIFAIHQMELEHQVTFAGTVSHQNIYKYYEDADIYLQYSIQEGFCNAVLEAQAMGLLTIVSNAEGLSENVIHRQTGWIVPKSAPRLLVERIIHVVKLDKKDKQKIITNARKRVRENFNLDIQNRLFNSFYLS